jgi:hypothetical protein
VNKEFGFLVWKFFAEQQFEEGGFSTSIFGYKSNLVSLIDIQTNIVKEYFISVV